MIPFYIMAFHLLLELGPSLFAALLSVVQAVILLQLLIELAAAELVGMMLLLKGLLVALWWTSKSCSH